MSTFLRTLIDRHQEGTAGRESVHKVQPRPKARFENDTGSDTFASSTLETGSEFSAPRRSDTDVRPDMNPHDPSAESLLTTDIRQMDRQAQDSVQPNNDKPAIASDYAPRLDDLNSRIEALTSKLQRQLYGQDTSRTADNQSVEPSEIDETTSENNGQANHRQWSTNDDINHRIQGILQTLHRQQPHQSGENSSLQSINRRTPDRAGSELEISRRPEKNVPDGNILPKEPVLNIPSISSLPEQEKMHQSGLLQIPEWLEEMRDDLSGRLQALNANTKTEPIVNVTIGRIEVKALPADSVKQSKVRINKPSGVMSLDDYLKLRERRG